MKEVGRPVKTTITSEAEIVRTNVIIAGPPIAIDSCATKSKCRTGRAVNEDA
jgi:hypothetical protein